MLCWCDSNLIARAILVYFNFSSELIYESVNLIVAAADAFLAKDFTDASASISTLFGSKKKSRSGAYYSTTEKCIKY